MACFLQTSAGDWDLSSGNFVVVTDVATETGQKLDNLFGLAKGEWFPDTRIGVPLLDFFLVKNPNLMVTEQVCRNVCTFAPAVTSVAQVDQTYTPAERDLEIDIKCALDDGTILQGGPGRNFVVTLSPEGT